MLIVDEARVTHHPLRRHVRAGLRPEKLGVLPPLDFDFDSRCRYNPVALTIDKCLDADLRTLKTGRLIVARRKLWGGRGGKLQTDGLVEASMRRHSFVGFASFLTASSLFLAACGDNKPASPANQDAGTGGVMDGGGTGGAAGTGGAGGAGGLVCSASFVSPANGATLNEANGGGVGMCSTDGFQATITVATNQPDGTVASLSVGNGPLVTAKVSGSTVTFSKIILPQQSNLPLKVSFSTTCSTSIMVNVDCSLPACSITAPVLTPVHPALNGVPATAGGDRASASGAAYQVAFKVKTDIEDGKDVRLVVTNNDVSGQQVILTAKAAAGFAPFPGVTLVPDGVYDVRAFCKNAAGAEGSSTSPLPIR